MPGQLVPFEVAGCLLVLPRENRQRTSENVMSTRSHPGKRVVVLLNAAFALFVTSLSVADEEAPGRFDTPQEQYTAIFKEYSPVSRGLRDAKTDRERKVAVERMSAFSSKFIDLAAKHPQHSIALTALRQATQVVGSTDSAALQTWEMNRSEFAAGSTDGSAARTVKLVLRDHVRSDELGPVIDRMRYGYRLEYEACLRTVLEENPHHEVQGLTCLVLAQYLRDKLHMLELVEDRPELAECYEIVFGKDYLPALRRLGRANLDSRIEALFDRAAKDYADVTFWNSTVGEMAKSALYDIRNLSIGKVAPVTEGKDQDGVPLKLSDHRGKVVLLYFWSEY